MTPEFARFLLESAGWTPQLASAIVYELMLRDTKLTHARIRDANNVTRRMLRFLREDLDELA